MIPNQELKEKFEIIDCTDRDLQLMLKDLRLIDAARETDHTVISLDDTVRELYANVSADIGELKDIVWVNPISDDENPVLWLINGAEPEERRSLRLFISSR